jgi:hypothetical protein
VVRTVGIMRDIAKLTAQQNEILEAVPTKNNEIMDAAKGVDLAKLANMVDMEKIEWWEAQYSHVTVPCLIIWGSRDPVLPVAEGHKLRDQLPNAWLRVLAPAKHSLMIEQPAACAQLVKDFLDKRLLNEPRWAICRVQTPGHETPPGTAAKVPAEDKWIPRHQSLLERANEMANRKILVRVALVEGRSVNIAMYESKEAAATRPVNQESVARSMR